MGKKSCWLQPDREQALPTNNICASVLSLRVAIAGDNIMGEIQNTRQLLTTYKSPWSRMLWKSVEGLRVGSVGRGCPRLPRVHLGQRMTNPQLTYETAPDARLPGDQFPSLVACQQSKTNTQP